MYRSFAVGLGPIPFVMIPEVSPANVSSIEPIFKKQDGNIIVRTHFMMQSVSSISSMALSLNCKRFIPLTQLKNQIHWLMF